MRIANDGFYYTFRELETAKLTAGVLMSIKYSLYLDLKVNFVFRWCFK